MQAIPLSPSKRSRSPHSDPSPAVLSICHKVAANASIGPELDRVPHQSQDPHLHPDLHSSHPLLPRQESTPRVSGNGELSENTQALGISGLGEDWDGERKGKVEEKPERENESEGTQWKQVVRCSMKAKFEKS